VTVIETPVMLSHLDGDHATFNGLADQTRTFHTPWGEFESTGKFPVVVIQRDIWEDLGRPTTLVMSLDLVGADV
jgi:hypothetical protein